MNAEQMQDTLIEGGFQKYRYNYENNIVISITCLICNQTRYDSKSIDEQWCENCKLHFLTPS